MTDPTQLDMVFGPGTGDTPEARALESSRIFVRSIDQLAEDSEVARGHRLTAHEALCSYGFEKLLEVATEGSALLAASKDAAGRVLRERREQLGLDQRHVARQANVDPLVVKAAEESRRLSIRDYEKVARVLGLDERELSFSSEPHGNDRVAVRLRALGSENPRMTRAAVAAIAEAAWVAMTQLRIEELLGRPRPDFGFEYSPNFGTPSYPAFRWGYFLASETRKRLNLGDGPVASLRDLAEETLGIPIIQSELGDAIAGVTIEVGNRRAIVVNLDGKNRHVYVRRSTIAHELGHILYDPPIRLNHLRVDDYDELEARTEALRDPVEQRANAFAAELLVPQREAVLIFDSGSADPVAEVMNRFGVSFTTARYQLWNGLERRVSLEQLETMNRRPLHEWQAAESFTVDYHPISTLRASRAGRFSALTLVAAERRLISWDTAAEWLQTSIPEAQRAVDPLKDLYPSVFAA